MRSGQRPAPTEAAGFVLAGGLSSRMGRDKALVELDGEPLVARALAILRGAGLTASIAGARTPLGKYALVADDEGLGPLGGVCAGLSTASADLVVFLPVDMPLMPPNLLRVMLDHARTTNAAATVASVNGYAQTFPGVVSRSALPMLKEALRQRERGCFAAFQDAARRMNRPFKVLPAELLAQTGLVSHEEGLPASLWFLNANGPEDLARAEGILAVHRRVC